jgi:head-tail adaptor
MQSGKFVHLITIERRVPAQGGTGNITETWEAVPGFARIMGEVLPDRASEFFGAKQIQATTNALVRLYYQPGIDPTMRVVHHVRPGVDEYWGIEGAVDYQRRQRELRLYCLQRDAEGYRRGTDLTNAEA